MQELEASQEDKVSPLGQLGRGQLRLHFHQICRGPEKEGGERLAAGGSCAGRTVSKPGASSPTVLHCAPSESLRSLQSASATSLAESDFHRQACRGGLGPSSSRETSRYQLAGKNQSLLMWRCHCSLWSYNCSLLQLAILINASYMGQLQTSKTLVVPSNGRQNLSLMPTNLNCRPRSGRPRVVAEALRASAEHQPRATQNRTESDSSGRGASERIVRAQAAQPVVAAALWRPYLPPQAPPEPVGVCESWRKALLRGPALLEVIAVDPGHQPSAHRATRLLKEHAHPPQLQAGARAYGFRSRPHIPQLYVSISDRPHESQRACSM